MRSAIKNYILRVFLASLAVITAMILVNNTFNEVRINSKVKSNKNAVKNIISSNKSYLIQEMYLGNKDALQRRVYSIANQIYQATGQTACVEIQNLSSCSHISNDALYTLTNDLLKSEIKVSVFPFKNENYYKKYFFINLIVILIFIIFISYWNLKNSLLPYLNSKEELKIQRGIQQSNDKICHDIKSPLTSLEYFLSSIKDKMSESERLIGRQSLERINDIILTLKTSNKAQENTEKVEKTIIYPLVKRIVSEKRIEYKNMNDVSIHIKDESKYGIFSQVNKSLFLRSLSNLINNSVEAKSNNHPLKITVSLSSDDDYITLNIIDNGVGIPSDKLNKIFNRGVSFNKANGKGIGLSEAKTYIEKVGGSLSLSSTEGVGTTIKIKLKIVTAPNWFKKTLNITNKSVCVIDDDKSIHTLWEQKLSGMGLDILHFRSSFDFEKWAEYKNLNEHYYLFDLELLGSPLDGLQLIEKYNLAKQSTLVTSHYDNEDVRETCNRVGVNIIPKESVNNIVLSTQEATNGRQIVLIDDDSLVHNTWQYVADKNNEELHSFYNVQDFINVAKKYQKNTPIYIDSNLGNNIKGEVEAKKLYIMGFKDITLSTGQKLDVLPEWIHSQQGKEYPTELS